MRHGVVALMLISRSQRRKGHVVTKLRSTERTLTSPHVRKQRARHHSAVQSGRNISPACEWTLSECDGIFNDGFYKFTAEFQVRGFLKSVRIWPSYTRKSTAARLLLFHGRVCVFSASRCSRRLAACVCAVTDRHFAESVVHQVECDDVFHRVPGVHRVFLRQVGHPDVSPWREDDTSL